jgi:acetyltransferase-like isoleucine patch superfamily enzyme
LITIGDNNQLTNCKIFTHGGANCVRNRHPKFDCFGKVTIGDWCYIGSNSLIMHGVSIGNNVLVAAGSVVTKSIPSNMVVAGNSAKIICTVEEYFNRNKDFDLETKGLNAKDKKKILSGGGGGDVNLLKN